MSVLIETSLGDLVIDLEVDKCPKTCENFLKLCKIKYYNLNAFFNISKDFIAQTGDPTATSTGGESFTSISHKSSSHRTAPPPRYFTPEIVNSLKHTTMGTVSMAVAPSDPPGCGSQFFITLSDGIEYLDGKHAVFGHVVEGKEVLEAMNEAFVDQEGRPLKDIRIRHIEILEDPFPDPDDLIEPLSPIRPPDDPSIRPRLGEDEDLSTTLPPEEAEAARRAQAATASALTLEMIGDLPFANVRPPENILFVCKLNPVTQDEDLELIFSRFGTVLSCEVIRDKRTGDSLQYAFIEFDKKEQAEMAYFKMQNVLVDDRRIWVDFSQSVSKTNGVYSINPSRSANNSRGRGRGGGGPGRGGGPSRGGGPDPSRHVDPPRERSNMDNMETPARYKDTRGDGRDGYGMVFETPVRREKERPKGREREERREEGGREKEREREGKRERERGDERGSGRREEGRHRERSPRREDYRDRDRERERDRDRDRERDRGGDRHRR